MKIVLAPDSFKDALSAPEVCHAIQCGILQARPDAECILFPMADGGEGTSGILAWHLEGEEIKRRVADPLMRPVEARYFLSASGEVAFIEMAQASGLQLLTETERNPLKTSTYGTGELIAAAISSGVKKILLGIGGSATNDAGMGMATALGWQFLSQKGEKLTPSGAHLDKIDKILPPKGNALYRITGCRIEVICDVTNPLFGPDGAAVVYGPQKGADDAAVKRLDAGLQHFSEKLEEHFGRNFAALPGAGAAGGLGAGAVAFLGAELRPGVEALMELTGFDQALKGANLLITGEGRLDGQTLHGKLIQGICKKASEHGVPVIAFCGALESSPAAIRETGLLAAFSVIKKPQDLHEAIASTKAGLEELAFNVLRVMDLRID